MTANHGPLLCIQNLQDLSFGEFYGKSIAGLQMDNVFMGYKLQPCPFPLEQHWMKQRNHSARLNRLYVGRVALDSAKLKPHY